METILLAAILSFTGVQVHPVQRDRAPQVIAALIAVVNTRGCIPFKGLTPEEQCIKTVKLEARWALSESSWLSNPHGWNDNGNACGVMQVQKQHLKEATCEEVRSDLFLGFREGHRIIMEGVERCGSVKAALGYYASGICGGAPALVRARCSSIGGC